MRLVTPRLGRPIEPAHVEQVDPWWRESGRSHEQVSADAARAATEATTADELNA